MAEEPIAEPGYAGDVETQNLLAEVRKRSVAVLYVVTNKNSDRFSIPNLTKYLKKNDLPVHEGATPDETIIVNAKRLLEFLDSHKGPVTATARLRHEVATEAIDPKMLKELFPSIQDAYVQQPLDYGRNSRYGDKWKISCYLVVMENWKPKILPHQPMVDVLGPTMAKCVELFGQWHQRMRSLASVEVSVMNAFVTRYRPVAEEDQLKKHIDGANVDGSVVLALPTDDPFEGGALHVWDGRTATGPKEHIYQMQPGDMLMMENAVWHQAMPISAGTRWALVLFLRLKNAIPLAA